MDKNGKHKVVWAMAGLLSCLLASSVVNGLIPTVLSLATSSKALDSSGLINYVTNGAALLVTDSTPEGPVPYEIDAKSGYQTGSTYILSAGDHTIELPSPYTAPSSGVTYSFSSWQDGPTANPRTITLTAGNSLNLNAIYSESIPKPPAGYATLVVGNNGGGTTDPSGRQNILAGVAFTITATPSAGYTFEHWTGIKDGGSPMTAAQNPYTFTPENQSTYQFTAVFRSVSSSGYFAYTGWESGAGWEYNEGTPMQINAPGSDYGTTTSPSKEGSRSLRVYSRPGGAEAGRFECKMWAADCGGKWLREIYQSYWVYIPTIVGDGWWQFWETRDYDYSWTTSIYILGTSPNQHWAIWRGQLPNDHSVQEWGYDIYASSYATRTRYGSVVPTVNPHPVPLGRWFRLEIYEYRAVGGYGVFKVWITDPNNPDSTKQSTRVLFSIENVPTASSNTDTRINWIMLKSYGPEGTASYYDELYCYNYNAHTG